MLEIVFGILRNLLCHPGLAPTMASHPELPQATVRALCTSDDPVALTGACSFLQDACGHLRPGAEVRRRTLRARLRLGCTPAMYVWRLMWRLRMHVAHSVQGAEPPSSTSIALDRW